ncbi:urate oxidase [Marinococcus halophilus]|nr:urate oxidase [Marinococcus halophilus]
MEHSQEEEERQAVREIHRIALLRLEAIIEGEQMETKTESKDRVGTEEVRTGEQSGPSAALAAEPASISQTATRTGSKKRRTMSYGKGDVFAYRTFSIPFTDITPIPESPYEGTNNTIFGLNVSVNITGEAFLPSFTEGDNSMVIATDSMKNFIQRHLGSYEGATVEGFLAYVGEAFLEKYDHVETAEVYADHLPFEKVNVDNTGYKSGVVFKKSRNENTAAMVKVGRTSFGAPEIIDQESYVKDVQLVKVVDNSFVGFIRDEYTTLPEDANRPLFIYLNIGWIYETPETAFGQNGPGYVAAEQVKDIAAAVFHETQTASIQQLIYYIGRRVLERFPQLQEVSFESQNHTWDTVVEDIPGSDGKVYTEPRRPYGFQRFSVHREDLNHGGEE